MVEKKDFCYFLRFPALPCKGLKSDSKSAEGNLVGVRPPSRHQSYPELAMLFQLLTVNPG